MSLSAKGQQQKYVRKLQRQEQCGGHIAYYLSGLSRAYFFPTTFFEKGCRKKCARDNPEG